MLQEVDDTELEDVSAGFAEDASHCDLLNASIILDIVAELIHSIDNSEVFRHE